MQQIFKNCGNFSVEVLPGMIRYPQESEKGSGKWDDAPAFQSQADGYVTQEGDMILGGFLHAQCAQAAVKQGRHFFGMSLPEKQQLVTELCQAHIRRHRSSGHEHYKHWLGRMEAFARHQNLMLLSRKAGESGHNYFRRLRQWTEENPSIKWPELREAVGTHLVLSPEPKLWKSLRSAGMHDRKFLHDVLQKTMKEFSDWRRHLHGPGRTLGWIAGTHVDANGADKHPHLHLIVLKRDASGKSVDWSVSSLRNRRGREAEPDPVQTFKRLFKKHVEREYARALEKSPFQAHAPRREPQNGRFQRWKWKLRTAATTLKNFYPQVFAKSKTGEFGAMLDLMRHFRREQSVHAFSISRQQMTPFLQPILAPGL